MSTRKSKIVKASWVSIIGNGILSASKITTGIFAGSLAVVGDGIDSATDIIISLITLFTAQIISRPPNVKYPYGYERADTIAARTLSFVIFFAGAQLLVSTIQRLFSHAPQQIPAPIAIYVTFISILGKLGLAYYQQSIGKKTGSTMLIANAQNMRNDVLISSSVLFGLACVFILRLPILDTLTALAVSFWILKTAYGIFWETTTDLMDGIKDPSIYQSIFAALDSVPGASNPHRIRIRKMGNLYVLEMDIEVNGQLTVFASHKIAHQVEESLRQNIPNLYDVVIHVEPTGQTQSSEKFGVCRDDFETNSSGKS